MINPEKIIKLEEIAGIDYQGFTCTGLCYDKNEEIFYIANLGGISSNIERKDRNPSIFVINKELTEVLDEILLNNQKENLKDVQGITIDYSNDSLWYCSTSENKIYNITKEGALLDEINVQEPIGIAYRIKSDDLYVITNNKVINIDKNGNVLNEFEHLIKAADQCCFDVYDDFLYCSAGDDYNNYQKVYQIDIYNRKTKIKYVLKDSFSVEGICLVGDMLYVGNDGLFHEAKEPYNSICLYKVKN